MILTESGEEWSEDCSTYEWVTPHKAAQGSRLQLEAATKEHGQLKVWSAYAGEWVRVRWEEIAAPVPLMCWRVDGHPGGACYIPLHEADTAVGAAIFAELFLACQTELVAKRVPVDVAALCGLMEFAFVVGQNAPPGTAVSALWGKR